MRTASKRGRRKAVDSFSYFYVALALIGAALAGIAVWSRRRTRWKTAAVALFAGAIALGYFAHSELLSRPKPVTMATEDLSAARVIGAALREDEAIYLWLKIDEEPRFFVMDWDTRLAQELQSAMRETRRSGQEVAMRLPGDDTAEGEAEGESAPDVATFYAVEPPILLPEKRLEPIRGPESHL